eukprot:TRINITY_DN1409_c1_g2_i1.p1 TRINITY_DN1409_c1_g2~~TRINITY_DN1409_c1_g2_i1.p1  ORF type:complete len:101 (+),score=11.24 TRINITY_DN1409_c1_g2_i1:83-385(+)
MPPPDSLLPNYGPNIPLAIGSGIAAALIVIGLVLAPGPDRSLNRVLIVTAVICVWLNWIMIFISQMYPILVPVDDRYSTYMSKHNWEIPPNKYLQTTSAQ